MASEHNCENFFNLLTFSSERDSAGRHVVGEILGAQQRIPLVKSCTAGHRGGQPRAIKRTSRMCSTNTYAMLPVNLGMLGFVASIGDIYVGKKGKAECCCCLPAGPRALRSPLCLLCG